MPATLFSAPASHPTHAARLMLEHKGIDYRRIDFAPPTQRIGLRLAGFRGGTVPALRLDGRRLQGSRAISRELDALKPDPPLFPSDPAQRAKVEEAEAWGDEVLQPAARRIAWATLRRERSELRSYLEGARLGLPHGLAAATAAPLIWLAGRLNGATDDQVRADLAALPGMLDKVDAWIAEGVLGGPERNAADFQIATSLRLLASFDDVAPLLAGRPAESLAREVAPDYSGHAPRALPREWLPAA